MSAEDRLAFRLPADFGGSSKSIYHRAIKKVYGRDHQGHEILQALQESPSVAIPTVLSRLKQKNEEWRRAQRDWNKIWREVDARNFYKSLDHQGITFKANDKKFITNKSLVSEIETAKDDIVVSAAVAKKKAKLLKSDPNTRSDAYDLLLTPHLEFEFKDLGVLQDALKLVFSFLDRSTIQYSSHERRSVERLLRSFVPLFCSFPVADFDAVFGPPIEPDATDNEDAMHDEAGMSDDGEEAKSGTRSGGTSGRRSAGGSNHGSNLGGVHPNDLRKKLLKTAQEKAVKARSGSASASRAVSPTASDDEHSKHSEGNAISSSQPKRKEKSRDRDATDSQKSECEEWAKLMPVALDVGQGIDRKEDSDMDVDKESAFEKLAKHGLVDDVPFFTNTTFYSILRLLQVYVIHVDYGIR
jgi:paired amphipathic helix protein Sin3a